MTAFTKMQMPDSIDTLEEVAVWALSALSFVNADLTAIEGPGISERTAQAGIFYVESDKKYRFLGRISVAMSAEYLSGNNKLWTYAQELSNTAIPTIFAA